MVPARTVGAILGIDVDFNQRTATATLQGKERTISVAAGSRLIHSKEALSRETPLPLRKGLVVQDLLIPACLFGRVQGVTEEWNARRLTYTLRVKGMLPFLPSGDSSYFDMLQGIPTEKFDPIRLEFDTRPEWPEVTLIMRNNSGQSYPENTFWIHYFNSTRSGSPTLIPDVSSGTSEGGAPFRPTPDMPGTVAPAVKKGAEVRIKVDIGPYPNQVRAVIAVPETSA